MEIKKEDLGQGKILIDDKPVNKLLEFQKKVSSISKDSVNPFFKSKYFDVNTVIDTIKPVLNEIGLVVSQPFGVTPDGKNVLRTEVYDDSKLITSSQIYLPEISDVQKFGAAITYFRRYALVSLLLLEGEEDDDGNSNQVVSPITTQNPDPIMNYAPKSLKPISFKQANFIKSLRDECGLDPISDVDLRKLTASEASQEIERLQKFGNEGVVIKQEDLPL